MPSTRALGIAAAVLLASPLALARGGQPKLECYFQRSLTDAAYQQKVFARVAKAWKHPPLSKVPQPGKKAVVQAVLAKDGSLLSAFVSMESGSKAWDAAALAAVKKAAPFGPLPKDFAYPSVEVHFHVTWEAT